MTERAQCRWRRQRAVLGEITHVWLVAYPHCCLSIAMSDPVIVWDIETVLDVKGLAPPPTFSEKRTRKYVLPMATSFLSTFAIGSFASAQ
jgi:hypothetical protein